MFASLEVQPVTGYVAVLTAEQAAAALGFSLRTANRHWAHAKGWLYRHMHERDGTGA